MLLFVLRRPIDRPPAGARRVHVGRRGDHLTGARSGSPSASSAFSAYLFMLRGFYAHQDTRTPFLINVGENVLNIVLAFALRRAVGRARARPPPTPIVVPGGGGVGAAGHVVQGARVPVHAACWWRWRGWCSPPCSSAEATWWVARARRRRPGCDGAGAPRRRHRGRRRRATSGSWSLLKAPEITAVKRIVPGRGRRPNPAPLASPACSSSSRSGGSTSTPSSPARSTSSADPKVQLEQAIAEAQDQHRAAQGAGGQRHRQPEADRDAAEPAMDELEKLNANARQALMMADDAPEGRRRDEGGRVQPGGRDVRQPADRGREGGREPEDDGARDDAGVRAGQGGGRAERPAAAEEARRAPKLLSQLDQAKMQEQMNSAMARSTRRSATTCRRSNEVGQQDRGPLRQGRGHVRAQRDVGRVAHARGRAGHRQRRGAGRLAEMRPELGITPPAVATIAPPAELTAESATPSESGPSPPPRLNRHPPRPRPTTAPPTDPLLISTSKIVQKRTDFAPQNRSSGGGEDDEVVAVDDLVGHAVGQVAVLQAGDAAQVARRRRDTMPVGEHPAVGVGDLDRVVGVERARRRRRTPAGSRPSSARPAPAGRRRRRRPCRRTGPRRRSTACGRRQPPVVGLRTRCPPARRRRASSSTRSRAASAITVAHARPRGDLGRRQLGRHAAAPPRRCRRRRRVIDEQRIVAVDLLDERGVGVDAADRR